MGSPKVFRQASRLCCLPAQGPLLPNQPRRKIARHVHEAARDAARHIVKTDAYADASRRRKKVEMLFAHLKRILRLDRLRLRGPNGARDEFLLVATAQNLRKLARLVPETPAPA
jgi:ABC-type ATPase with predicted acetyltransferase domain